jgi:ABC-type Fe3+ transport system permease subunit
MSSRTIVWIAVAFVVGAIAPLLGLLAAAFVFGSWWSDTGQRKLCDPKLLEEIREIEHKEQRIKRR